MEAKSGSSQIHLGKYSEINQIGKGGFGEVFLVEHEGVKYALKRLDKDKLGENSSILAYLYSEIACMKDLKEETRVLRLIQSTDTPQYLYLLLQYCNGGDLSRLQSEEANMVFPLEKATQIMAEIIKGLERIHRRGYLHRDIKSENVLVKNDKEGRMIKIADFGFSKKVEQNGATVCGTELFMAPEIFLKEDYEYDVDMWSLGVLFFYMLNKDYPFKIQPQATFKCKYQELIKQATQFNYTKVVMQTKKKIEKNCTPEVCDLFRRIFEPSIRRRIKFHQIRSHPLLAKYFIGKSSESELYQEGGRDTVLSLRHLPSSYLMDRSRLKCILYFSVADENFRVERQYLSHIKDILDFIETAINLFANSTALEKGDCIPLLICLSVYYEILFCKQLPTNEANKIEVLTKNRKKGNWKAFVETNDWKNFMDDCSKDRVNVGQKLIEFIEKARMYESKKIIELSPKMMELMEKRSSINMGTFDQYLETTLGKTYKILSEMAREDPDRNTILFGSVVLTFINNLDFIIKDPKLKLTIFESYAFEKNKFVFGYSEAMQWLRSKRSYDLAHKTIKLLNELGEDD